MKPLFLFFTAFLFAFVAKADDAMAAGVDETPAVATDTLFLAPSAAPCGMACGANCCASDPTTRFRSSQLMFPAAAIAFGGAGVKNHLLDTSGHREKHKFEDALQYVPVVAYAGLGFIPGVKHRHNFGERLMAGATAYVVMTAVSRVGKLAIREPRPDTGARSSFPSGHTATAFCGAELTRIEYGNAYGAAAYAFAATTGVMRVVNNRHWCNDVLAGAGIGFLSAHVGYWLLPAEKRLVQRVFKHRRAKGLNAYIVDREPTTKIADAPQRHFVLAPAYDVETRSPFVSFGMNF